MHAVSDPEDAEPTCAAGVKAPIVLYASTCPEAAEAMAKLGLIATVQDFQGPHAFSRVKRAVDMHVEIDCGYGRRRFSHGEW